MSVIDLGGYYWNWVTARVRPKRVLVVNVDGRVFTEQPAWVKSLEADACDLPSKLYDESFDLVYSNSLLEHVGGHYRRRAMADAVHRLAPHHWIQTPARPFPIEPHWMFPGFQFLPVSLRAQVSRGWPLSPTECRGQPLAENVRAVLQVELVSSAEMRHLFPKSELYKERLAGLTKSITAVL
jgi:hypothetical protein